MKRLAGLLIVIALNGCVGADDGFDVGLVNTQDDSKSDSITGKRLSVNVTDVFHVIATNDGEAHVTRSGDDPWVVDGTEFLTTTVVDEQTSDAVWIDAGRYELYIPPLSGFISVDVENDGDIDPTELITTDVGYMLIARDVTRHLDDFWNADNEWSVLTCESGDTTINYFEDRAVIDYGARTITTDQGSFTFAECGVPGRVPQLGFITLPISNWFNMKGTYHFDVSVSRRPEGSL